MKKKNFFGGTPVERRKGHGLVMVRERKKKGDRSSSYMSEEEEVFSESETSEEQEEETASTALDSAVPEQAPAFTAPKPKRPKKDRTKGTSVDFDEEERSVPVPREPQRPGPDSRISGFRGKVDHITKPENIPPADPLPNAPQTLNVATSTHSRNEGQNTSITASGPIQGLGNVSSLVVKPPNPLSDADACGRSQQDKGCSGNPGLPDTVLTEASGFKPDDAEANNAKARQPDNAEFRGKGNRPHGTALDGSKGYTTHEHHPDTKEPIYGRERDELGNIGGRQSRTPQPPYSPPQDDRIRRPMRKTRERLLRQVSPMSEFVRKGGEEWREERPGVIGGNGRNDEGHTRVTED